MKKIIFVFFVFFVILLFVGYIRYASYCQKESNNCRKTIETFQKACNELNEDDALKCLYFDFVNIDFIDNKEISKIVHKSLNKIISLSYDTDYQNEIMKTISIDINEIGLFYNKSTKLKCTISYEKDGMKPKYDVEIKMKKVDGEWYIYIFNLGEVEV